MDRPTWRTALARFLAPGSLFVGVAAGFLACCLLGRLVSGCNLYREFERFHLYLTPETLYYPTPCQLRELGHSRLDRNKIAVVVAGSSRMQGTGQQPDELWTRRLQERLGDRFCVINFGFRRASTCEMGLTAAEMLAREYPRLLVVTDCTPAWIDPRPDGGAYPYFFWSAYHRGLLAPDAQRLARIRELAPDRARAEERAGKTVGWYDDLQLRARLDGWCCFDDLWNACAYEVVCTAWTETTRRTPTQPRRLYADPEPKPPPVEQRHGRPGEDEGWAVVKRNFFTPGSGLDDLCVKDGDGRWVPNPRAAGWADFRRNAATCLPETLRGQTLVLVFRYNPYYVDPLPADQRAYLLEAGRLSVEQLDALGFAALEVGEGYTAADYADVWHLAGPGGAKLADAVADKIRAMAERLHYLD